jgi:perosamine synthetase
MIRLVRPSLAAEDIQAALGVLQSGWLKQGPVVRKVEQRLAEMVGTEDALLVSSCTAALYMALRRIGVSGQEVIVPALGFGAPVAAIVAAGGTALPSGGCACHREVLILYLQPGAGAREDQAVLIHSKG